MAPVHNLCNTIRLGFQRHLRQIAVPDHRDFRAIVDILYAEGFLASYASGDLQGPYHMGVQVPETPTNRSQRRLWLDLKYRNGAPVLSEMSVVSKPSRRVFASVDELCAIATMRSPSTLLQAQRAGQVTIVKTPYGIVELKTALAKGVGGEVLCYAR